MNVKRFTARTSRDALTLVRQAFGDDAVVLSTRPSAEGVEVLAMAAEGVDQFERVAASASPAAAAPRQAPARPPGRAAAPAGRAAAPVARAAAQEVPAAIRAQAAPEVQEDVEQLAMSTLSFQDYVRERMLKRRQAAKDQADGVASDALAIDAADFADTVAPPVAAPAMPAMPAPRAAAPRAAAVPRLSDPIEAHELAPFSAPAPVAPAALPAEPINRRDQIDLLGELRAMKGLIEDRFGALAFMEKLQRDPRHAQLTQKLLDCGFSPALIRKLLDGLPAAEAAADETAWATHVLERNLSTGEAEPALEDAGGVFAMIGSTGVGKTTSTAKIAAAFATKHGAAHLGLITLDAYRVGAQEQLRTYGRILGAPVHTAHDRASLEDLLDLLSAKKMVLIDTAGLAQRDTRTREMMDMLSHRSIQKLLVLDASSHGETIDDVIVSWRASQCRGVVLSKIDEAVKLAPALDALIRHKLKVIGVANGQRVPEDWHRLSSHALVHRAMRAGSAPAYRMDASEVSLVFTTPPAPRGAAALHA